MGNLSGYYLISSIGLKKVPTSAVFIIQILQQKMRVESDDTHRARMHAELSRIDYKTNMH